MSKNNYWLERLSEIAQDTFDENNEQMQKELLKLYKSLMRQIAKEVDDIYFKLLEDNVARTDIWTYKHYKSLSKKLSLLIAKLGANEEALLYKQLEIALREVYQGTILPNTSQAIIDEMVIKQLLATSWSEKHFSQAIWDNKAKMLEVLKASITESVALGKSKDKAVEAIMQKCNNSFKNADRLVRTELMAVINNGQKQRYKEAGYTKVKILVAEDERLCDECMKNDGKIFNIDDVRGILPTHPRCRCTYLAVLNSKKLGES